MRDRLRERGAPDVDIAPGGTGAFEISVDGAVVFSKLRNGRFPTDEEVEGLIDG